MKTLQVNNIFKFAEKDNCEKGCLPDTAISFSIEETFIENGTSKKHIKSMIERLMNYVGCYDKSNVLLNSCEEVGRIDIQVYENDNGDVASLSEMALFREGKKDLWLATYSAYLEKVQSEEVNLSNINL